jgi:hypothetical protein
MNANQTHYSDLSTAGYMPYFYASGRAFLYAFSSPKSASSASSRYDFTSDLIRANPPIHHPTVEEIIARGYFSIPKSEPELALISDKKETAGLGLSDIIGQIRKRYDIYHRNLYELDWSSCNAYSAMLSMVASRGGVWFNSREVYGLSKRQFEVDLQKQEERLALWSDISKLKQLLPEQAQNYLSAYRKMAILEDTGGDSL